MKAVQALEELPPPDPSAMSSDELITEIKRAQGDLTGDKLMGKRLKRLREDRGLSQRELATKGVSYAYISRIEAGTRQPSSKALTLLALQLGVSPRLIAWGDNSWVEAETWVYRSFGHLPTGELKRMCRVYGEIRQRNAQLGIGGILRLAA